MTLAGTIHKERYAQHGETSWEDTSKRLAKCAALAESNENYDKWYIDFFEQINNFNFIPGGRIIANSGKPKQHMMNCNVLAVEDSRESIGELLKDILVVSGTGGGVGISFSKIRPKGAPIATMGGVSSGTISFMHCADAVASTIKTGGSRRAALMISLSVYHPDILDFLHEKLDLKKLTNANISIEIDSKFIQAVKDNSDWNLVWAGKIWRTIKARDIWDILVDNSFKSGEPGILNLGYAREMNNGWWISDISTTNPCFIGSTRIATDKGLLTAKELYDSQENFLAIVDNRTIDMGGRKDFLPEKNIGVLAHKALPIFKTGENMPVYKLETEHGYQLISTETHKFCTTDGYKELKELTVGDNILLQSGEGLWGNCNSLPFIDYTVTTSTKSRFLNSNIIPPTEWSKELGELLGLFIGNGFIYRTNQRDTYTWGITVRKDDKDIVSKITKLMFDWFKVNPLIKNKNNCIELRYKGFSSRLLLGLGIHNNKATKKYAPTSIFTAPKEAVIGFISGLFSADGTINARKNGCDIRLASSSRQLLQDVQLLLSNLGIISKIYLRRESGSKLLPDSNRQPKLYNVSAQYELIMSGINRENFINKINFMQNRQKEKFNLWATTIKKRSSTTEMFITKVKSIDFFGNEDVYDTTVSGPHSVIVNGIVTAQCGELPMPEFSACCLGAVNVSNFVKEKNLDKKGFEKAIEIGVRYLDNIIDVNEYSLDKIKYNATSDRRIGLGLMGLHYAMLKLGIRYGSEEGAAFTEKIYEILRNHSYWTSCEIAKEKGAFPKFDTDKYLTGKFVKALPTKIRDKIREYGIRNIALNTNAPTGTTSIIAEVSSGIEPIFAPVYERTFWSEENGDSIQKKEIVSDSLFSKWIAEGRDISHFEGSHNISPEWHLKIQEAAQRYIDSAVSKTINLPTNYSKEDLSDLLLKYIHSIKGVTIYKDGSRGDSPLKPLNINEYSNCNKDASDIGIANDCPSGICEI